MQRRLIKIRFIIDIFSDIDITLVHYTTKKILIYTLLHIYAVNDHVVIFNKFNEKCT